MRRIVWYTSGHKTKEEAEASLEEKKSWFNKTFDSKSFALSTSIGEGPHGWKSEIVADEET